MSEDSSNSLFLRLDRSIVQVLKICMTIGMVLIVVMAALTTAHAVGRYLFNTPIPGLIEISCILLILAVFMGGAYAAVIKGHITVGLFVDRLPKRAQNLIDIFNYFCCLAVTVIAAWQSFTLGLYIKKTGVEYTILGVPRFPFVLIVGFGWALFSVALIILLVHLFIQAIKK